MGFPLWGPPSVGNDGSETVVPAKEAVAKGLADG